MDASVLGAQLMLSHFPQTVETRPAHTQPHPRGPRLAAVLAEGDLNVRGPHVGNPPSSYRRGVQQAPAAQGSGSATGRFLHTRNIKCVSNTEEPPASQTLRLLLHSSTPKSPGFSLFLADIFIFTLNLSEVETGRSENGPDEEMWPLAEMSQAWRDPLLFLHSLCCGVSKPSPSYCLAAPPTAAGAGGVPEARRHPPKAGNPRSPPASLSRGKGRAFWPRCFGR